MTSRAQNLLRRRHEIISESRHKAKRGGIPSHPRETPATRDQADTDMLCAVIVTSSASAAVRRRRRHENEHRSLTVKIPGKYARAPQNAREKSARIKVTEIRQDARCFL